VSDECTYTISELVAAVGPLCGDEPEYWKGLVEGWTREGILRVVPFRRRGSGVHRRYSADECRLAAVLFLLKARLQSHISVIADISNILHNGFADQPTFRRYWEAAAAGESCILTVGFGYFGPSDAPYVDLHLPSEAGPAKAFSLASRVRDVGGIAIEIDLGFVFGQMMFPPA
jgi:hypothetical protein